MAGKAKENKLEAEALLKIEEEAVKGRKDKDEEGRVGRKGESLESDDEVEDKDAEGIALETAEEIAVETTTTTGPPLLGGDRPEYDVRKHKTARRPLLPTKAEFDNHYPLHLNYRSWCKHCVAGKARSNQHIQNKEEDRVRLGTTLNADYAFMSGEHDEGEQGMQPALIMYDDDKDSFWAVGIDAKGATEAMVQYGVGVIEQSGYIGERIIFKSDQEPSIVALKNAISAARVGELVPIESPVCASKSNGMMENAVKIWQGQLRTIKHDVESRIGKVVEPGSAFVYLVDSVLCRYS